MVIYEVWQQDYEAPGRFGIFATRELAEIARDRLIELYESKPDENAMKEDEWAAWYIKQPVFCNPPNPPGIYVQEVAVSESLDDYEWYEPVTQTQQN